MVQWNVWSRGVKRSTKHIRVLHGLECPYSPLIKKAMFALFSKSAAQLANIKTTILLQICFISNHPMHYLPNHMEMEKAARPPS